MHLRANKSGIGVALALAGLLAGCSGDFDSGWFSKPLTLAGNRGYTFSDLGETKLERRVTADDLVDANGACPRAAPALQTASVNPDADNPAAALGTAAELRGGIGIGMTECEVVSRVGAPTAINLGRGPNGERTAEMTFQGGPRPGIYRFVGGRLTEMDRVAELAPPQPEKPVKPAKKKRAKTKQPPKPDGSSPPPVPPRAQ